jgi:hypothetical protein
MNKEHYYQIFEKFRTDKGSLHGYDYMYDVLFTVIGEPQKLLEIGIKDGNSIAAWKHIFPNCDVTGVDIKDNGNIRAEAKQNSLHFIDSTNPEIKNVVGSGYDVIIDDGSHMLQDQLQTFFNLEGCWNKAYVIEDVHGVYSDQYIREQLVSKGYTNIETYASHLKNVTMLRTNGTVSIDFFGMVIFKERHHWSNTI